MKQTLAILVSAFAVALVVVACGGGTDGTGAVPEPTTAVTSSGAMVKGSVILNGTHFDPARASVIDDRGRGAAQLDTGMVIKLRGRSDDGVTGLADRIDVENVARGPIQSIDTAANPPRFTVGGLIVVVEDQTVFANAAGFAALAVGTRVEVHGLRDAAGLLRATRIEVIRARDGLDELRGVVGNLTANADRFTLNGTVVVDYSAAVFGPDGASEASLVNGTLVEVRGTLSGSVFTASQVDIEDLEDAPFKGKPGEKQEVEGFISSFSVHPGAFQVDGHAVATTATTTFAGGTADDLADDAMVEVDGVLDAQMVLVATKVQFKRLHFKLKGLATAVDPAAGTVTVLGQQVQTNDLTRIDVLQATGTGKSQSLADVTPNVDCVDVHGQIQRRAFVAERIKELNRCDDAAPKKGDGKSSK